MGDTTKVADLLGERIRSLFVRNSRGRIIPNKFFGSIPRPSLINKIMKIEKLTTQTK
jgi:hypothetical protein